MSKEELTDSDKRFIVSHLCEYSEILQNLNVIEVDDKEVERE